MYQYAASHGYELSVGRIGKLECDFIARDMDMNYAYIQVAMTIMTSREAEEREFVPLERIRDNYPKYLLTRNGLLQRRNGIKHRNIPDFMKNGERFI